MAPSLLEKSESFENIHWLQYKVGENMYTAMSNGNKTFRLFKDNMILYPVLHFEQLENMIRPLTISGIDVYVV